MGPTCKGKGGRKKKEKRENVRGSRGRGPFGVGRGKKGRERGGKGEEGQEMRDRGRKVGTGPPIG